MYKSINDYLSKKITRPCTLEAGHIITLTLPSKVVCKALVIGILRKNSGIRINCLIEKSKEYATYSYWYGDERHSVSIMHKRPVRRAKLYYILRSDLHKYL